MGLSKSQTIRIKKAFKLFGSVGLISKRRGKPSPNKIPDKVLQDAISIINKKYSDFGPTFACEKLIEKHNIKISSYAKTKTLAKTIHG